MPCCGRCRANVPDVEAPHVDVSLLQAYEKGLQLGICLPRCRMLQASSSSSSSWWPFRNAQDELQLSIVVIGGPDCYIFGPKKETAWCRCGGRVVHEVVGLLPDTRYTVEVSVLLEGHESSDQALLQKLEVRTTPATTCQFAGEDWGRSCWKKEGKEEMKEKKSVDMQPIRSATRSPGGRAQAAGPSISPQPAVPPRSVSDADESTIAPSELDGRDLEDRQEDHWDFGVEEVQVGREKLPDVSEAVQVEEVVPAAGRSVQCNLCSLMDCFRLMRLSENIDRDDATEVTLSAASSSQGDVVQAEPARRRRPLRPPFPGLAVDPASVGLELLPALNESQLQHVLDSRMRNARDGASEMVAIL